MSSDHLRPAAVWDIWIRLFHWSLALSVGFLLLSGMTGFGFVDWHRTVGEVVLGLIAFRLVWSVVGPANARLHALIRGPRAVIEHMQHLIDRDVPADSGHNAAGGWAVLLMLFLVGFQAVSGSLIADEDEIVEGRFYGAVGDSASEMLYRLHHINAEILQVVVVAHVVMIIVYASWGRRNLLPPMISRRIASTSKRHLMFGAVIAIVIGLIGYLIFG